MMTIKVGVLVVNHHNQLLLIKERATENTPALWNIIKGTFDDQKDSNVAETAIRECLEEGAVTIGLLGLFSCFIGQNRMQLNFLARVANQINQSRHQEAGEYIEERRWFAKKELISLEENDFFSKRAYLLVQNFLMSGQSTLTPILEYPE